MKLWKYKIFNSLRNLYYPEEYFTVEDVTLALSLYKKRYKTYSFEVHKIEVGNITLTIENDI